MEEKMNEQIEFLKALYQETPEGAIILDEKGIIIWVNSTATNFLGKKSIGENGPELLRQNGNTEILWPPDISTIRHRYFNESLMEMVSHKIPGSSYFLVIANRLDGEKGIKTILEKGFSDITAQTVHDLKSPMNGICGFTDLILDELKILDYSTIKEKNQETISNIKSYAEIVLKSSNNLVNKIHNILLLSKLDQGLMKPNISEINVLDFTKTMIGRFSVNEKELGIKISRKMMSSEHIINADYNLLERAIENMILNAIEALDSNASEKEIILSFDKNDHGVISFQVINPGIISPRNLEAMFKTQFTTKKNGNGLGTKTIRQVAEAHGGKPSVECKEKFVYVSISFPDAK